MQFACVWLISLATCLLAVCLIVHLLSKLAYYAARSVLLVNISCVDKHDEVMTVYFVLGTCSLHG